MTDRSHMRLLTLLEQLWNGSWHSQLSLYHKGFEHSLILIAIVRGYVEVNDDDDVRITTMGKHVFEGT